MSVPLQHDADMRLDDASDGTIRDGRQALRHAWSFSAGLIPLALVVLALLGSVVIPARQTWLIARLLRETTKVLVPARLLQAQLQSGLAEEIGALQSYALSGDTASLGRYRAVAARNDQRLAALDTLGEALGGPFLDHLAVVHQLIDAWRTIGNPLVQGRNARGQVAATLQLGQARYDTTMAAVAALSFDLAAVASTRDDRVQEREHLSLAANASLVLAAFVALSAVVVLTRRERRLTAVLRRRLDEEATRARQEAALREAAEALAGGLTIDEVTQRIAHASLEPIHGRGAFVARIGRATGQPDELTVAAVAGTGVPPIDSSCELRGSYAEQVLESGMAALVPMCGNASRSGMLGALATRGDDGAAGSAIAIPLAASGVPVGALFVLSARGHFRADDVARAAIYGHLAALAYEKVKLLDESNEGRRRLERAMSSRSRLMRGFSHDVKNPIGAADGYAALLHDGMYGDLNQRQRESVERMRRSLHSALSLIDDLHELARAETGHLAVSADAVNLPDLLRSVGEDYQGSAAAAGLSFSIDVSPDVPIVRTSESCVRQITSNLLSNAIKYTEAGSVLVRATQRAHAPFDGGQEWVAVDVSDTGRGIAPDKLEFIFQEFARIGDSPKPGAGLGLAISRLLAQALGGRITVASELRRGSTFTLWLPIAAPPQASQS